MTNKTKTEIKAFFQTSDTPSEAQFIDLIDSYVDKSGPLGVLETAVSGGSAGFVYASAADADIIDATTALSRLGATVVTTAAVSAVAMGIVATTAQANAGTATGVLMDPVLTKNAIVTQAFTSASFATTAQANAGTNDGTVMNPVLVKNAIAALGAAGAYTYTQIATSTPGAVATVDFTGIAATYKALLAVWSGVSCDTAARQFLIAPNCGAGLGSEVTLGFNNTNGTVSAISGNSYLPPGGGYSRLAATTESGSLWLPNYTSAGYKDYNHGYLTNESSISGGSNGKILSTGAVQGLRFYWNSTGNFDAGTITLYGVS